ncbi:MAG: hypothetical protein IT478_02685 [Xanthomonadales bacterium]|nr:hypothetical protein [Xanthomonadales bacterium]
MSRPVHLVVLVLLLLSGVDGRAQTVARQTFALDYTIELLPAQDQARVTIALGKGAERVTRLGIGFDAKRYSGFKASQGQFVAGAAGNAVWTPTGPGSKLSYLVRITRKRDSGDFDARMTADWALFRGDKVIPFITAKMKKGTESVAHLRFVLPPGWTNVDTGWMRLPDGRFVVDNTERRFDRPIGWIIAGKVGTRRDQLGLTEVSIGAPKGDPLDRMDALTMIHLVWSEIEGAFGKTPKKILIVGAGDPMWRGGLSAPNSLFFHSQRPLVSENATSTLFHELTHVVTRISAENRSDWIAEGLAEFYSVELVWRAGGMSDDRRERVYRSLRDWGRGVKSLRTEHSSAEITARAVVLLRELDDEIRARTRGNKDIDDVTRILRVLRKVSTAEFIAAAEKVLGGKSRVLATPLLK